MNKAILFFLCLQIYTFKCSAIMHIVPLNTATIQAAIDISANGDTVLVLPGTWYENINFRGKNIVLTSRYFFTLDTADICQTILNGSQPVFPDTASCVIFNSGEDSTAVIQGFTITGGAGTRWLDVHGAGTYREGGGIITEFSSPVIRYNRIVNNQVFNVAGVNSTGGGGIRCGDGHPFIYGNLIAYNGGSYGGGVVFNYCPGAVLKNNIIAHNTGGQLMGGGGIWASGTNASSVLYLENNTIAYNYVSATGPAGGNGGALFSKAITIEARNNIIWGNKQSFGSTLRCVSGSVFIGSWLDVDSLIPGIGNINTDPLFVDTIWFLLTALSPCIDAGDSTLNVNDLVSLPQTAMFPSMGTERNDMGTYGGPLTLLLPVCSPGPSGMDELKTAEPISVYPNPVNGLLFISSNTVNIQRLELYQANGSFKINKHVKGTETSLSLKDMAPGIYFLKIIQESMVFLRKIVIQ